MSTAAVRKKKNAGPPAGPSGRGRGRPADDKLAARRQEQILAAAARFFAGATYATADVQLLADQLGVGKGTIYRYFPSKRELFLAAVDRGMRRLHESVEAAWLKADDPLEQIALAIRAYLAYFDDHPEFVELLIQERAVFRDRAKPTYFQHRDARVDIWRQRFRDLMAVGRVRQMSAERITDVLSSLVYGTMFINYFTGRTKSFEDQAEEMLDVVNNGILAGTAARPRTVRS